MSKRWASAANILEHMKSDTCDWGRLLAGEKYTPWRSKNGIRKHGDSVGISGVTWVVRNRMWNWKQPLLEESRVNKFPQKTFFYENIFLSVVFSYIFAQWRGRLCQLECETAYAGGNPTPIEDLDKESYYNAQVMWIAQGSKIRLLIGRTSLAANQTCSNEEKGGSKRPLSAEPFPWNLITVWYRNTTPDCEAFEIT